MAVEFRPYANFDAETGRLVKAYLKRTGFATAVAARVIVGRRSGRLKSTIKSEPRAKKSVLPGHYEIYVRSGGPRAPYAKDHHQGFAPFRVVKEGDVLVFPSGGRVIYTHEIDHPGFAGNPYMVLGAQAALADSGAVVKHYKGRLGPGR